MKRLSIIALLFSTAASAVMLSGSAYASKSYGYTDPNKNYLYNQNAGWWNIGEGATTDSGCKDNCSAKNGSAINAFATAISVISDKRITPAAIAKTVKEQGIWDLQGTPPNDLIDKLIKIYGDSKATIAAGKNKKQRAAAIQKTFTKLKKYVIIVRASGTYPFNKTETGGHYVVLLGYKKGKIYGFDPATSSKGIVRAKVANFLNAMTKGNIMFYAISPSGTENDLSYFDLTSVQAPAEEAPEEAPAEEAPAEEAPAEEAREQQEPPVEQAEDEDIYSQTLPGEVQKKIATSALNLSDYYPGVPLMKWGDNMTLIPVKQYDADLTSGGKYDCIGFVAAALKKAGFSSLATTTFSKLRSNLSKETNGWKKMGGILVDKSYSTYLKTGKVYGYKTPSGLDSEKFLLLPGDVLITTAAFGTADQHTFIYVGAVGGTYGDRTDSGHMRNMWVGKTDHGYSKPVEIYRYIKK